jgi:plastocyanin
MTTRTFHPIGGAAVALCLGLGLGACSSKSATQTPASTTARAVIKTFAFQPNPVTVPVGGTLTWTNEDDIAHTVTSGTREYAPGNTGTVTAEHRDGVFDITLDGKGKTATMKFPTAGTFHYFCSRHPGMEANVVVK